MSCYDRPAIRVKGRTCFYDGWLASVFGFPLDADECRGFRDGYRIAKETGQPGRMLALFEELFTTGKLQNVIVTTGDK